jgi:hypothetical protein
LASNIEETIIMEQNTVVEPGAPRAESCPCRDLGEHIAALLGVRSPDARQHLRNARIEMLKAIRTLLDERIEQLSRSSIKGRKISVD